jgi:uncharacterized membrane protein YgaE (UPF0421/DUF939 family)
VPVTARSLLTDPVRWSSLIQLLKTVVAAVIAWVLASQTFGLPQPFLAPWAALLVVHATVYRTFSRGLKQVTAAVLGVMLAWAVGNVWGLTNVAVGALLAVGLLVGTLRWFRDESSAVAATGLIVLTTGFSTQDQVLVDRLYDTAIGIGVGLAVNLLVWPPMRDVSAARAIEAVGTKVGALLCEIASGLRARCDEEQVDAWVNRTRELDEELDQAWALLRQAKESGRLNLRRAARAVKATDVFEEVLRNNDQAVAETRSMARTLGHSIDNLVEWEPAFRERWLDLLQMAGEAISEPDPDRVSRVRAELNTLAQDLSDRELSGRHWPEYGALIMNLRNVVTSMDQVARHHHLELPRYARRERVAHRIRMR